jgi:hypothetical protein
MDRPVTPPKPGPLPRPVPVLQRPGTGQHRTPQANGAGQTAAGSVDARQTAPAARPGQQARKPGQMDLALPPVGRPARPPTTPPRRPAAPPRAAARTESPSAEAPLLIRAAKPLPPSTPTRMASAPPVQRPDDKPSGPAASVMETARAARRRRLAASAEEASPLAGATPSPPHAQERSGRKGLTRSPKTLEQYLHRGRLLLDRYRRENDLVDHPDEVDPVQVVHWLLSLKPGFKAGTWRLYRQAAYAVLEGQPHAETERALALIDDDFVEETAENDGTPPKPGGRKTSALKEKKLPLDHLNRIRSYLRYHTRSKVAPVLLDWLDAGLATGLRPIEWRATDLEERELDDGRRLAWLYVLSAKHSNGRSNGVVRTLDLTPLSEETLAAVRRMSRRGLQWFEAGKFDSMQSQCAQLLYTICERLFHKEGAKDPRYYSLYSCRHQFIANAKATMSPEEVSALVGHGVTRTAAESYGKRRSAWGPEHLVELPKPMPEEVATVRQRIRFFDERMRRRAEAGLPPPPGAIPLGDSETSAWPV